MSCIVTATILCCLCLPACNQIQPPRATPEQLDKIVAEYLHRKYPGTETIPPGGQRVIVDRGGCWEWSLTVPGILGGDRVILIDKKSLTVTSAIFGQ